MLAFAGDEAAVDAYTLQRASAACQVAETTGIRCSCNAIEVIIVGGLSERSVMVSSSMSAVVVATETTHFGAIGVGCTE